MESTQAPSAEEVHIELERILRSPPFANAHRSQRFLRYIVDCSLNNRDEHLKEFAIAMDVFARNVSYDPSINATVRVEAGRLRSRLRDYYAGEGSSDPVIIEVPKGGYRATFSERNVYSAAPAEAPPASEEANEPAQSPAPYPASPLLHPSDQHPGKWILLGSLVVAAVVLLFTTIGPHPFALRFLRGKTRPAITSLAVIPLDNLSGDAGQEYFADGMTDELITMLARDSSLRVVSRTSAMQYKGARRPLPEIARELGVDGILEGSVSHSGNRVHMNVQLIQAPTDTHIWAESYDRDENQIAALPHEVAQAIFRRINGSDPSVVPERYVNPEAHDAYLRGRYLWYAGQYDKAFDYFKKATQLQPDYAPGWSGMAMYYGAGLIIGNLDPAKALLADKEAAIKAVQLDDSFAEGHLSLCAANLINEWDFNLADKECLRAIELDPEFAEAFHFRAKLLGVFNRNDEALEAQKKATELDPVAHPWAMAMAYQVARRNDEAIADVRQRLESYPEDSALVWHLYTSYRRKGMYPEAVQALGRMFQLQHDSASADALQHAYQAGGYKAVVLWQLSVLKKKAQADYVSPVELAALYAQAGDRERALANLEEGFRKHAPQILWIQSEPAFNFLHFDERYRSIIQSSGLPPVY